MLVDDKGVCNFPLQPNIPREQIVFAKVSGGVVATFGFLKTAVHNHSLSWPQLEKSKLYHPTTSSVSFLPQSHFMDITITESSDRRYPMYSSQFLDMEESISMWYSRGCSWHLYEDDDLDLSICLSLCWRCSEGCRSMNVVFPVWWSIRWYMPVCRRDHGYFESGRPCLSTYRMI